jgi:quinoprotein glucose dehydrogenase
MVAAHRRQREHRRDRLGNGLVFVGATDDRRFRAFDSKTGKELWATQLPAAGNANPMTYQAKNGKQYVAIVAGSQVVAYALP